MSELLELCNSNNLSLDALQETINLLGPRVSSQNLLCFHKACENKNGTLEIVQLLYYIFPEALRLRDDDGWLPIHHLCCNEDLDDSASIDILRFMLEIDPTLPREVGSGWLPVHSAVAYKSITFCKILIDVYPESLRIEADGMLPIHIACDCGNRDDTVDTNQYMLELNPEISNAEDGDGWLPIHLAAMKGRTKSIELFLKYDPDAASKEVNDESRRLPLHCACDYDTNISDISSIQVLYDAYPEAIFASDADGDTPLDNAQRNGNQPAIDFLQTQLEYASQAQDEAAMTTSDDDGWLPLHHALKDNVPLGSIKLLTRANPAAVQVADQNGAYPLHIACEFGSVKVVQLLVELAGVTLNNVDTKNNYPLHYACRRGNLGIVNYLLEANVPSVSDRNNDNKLAIHLLFECGSVIFDRESMEYVETVWQLLLTNPEVVRDFMPC